MLYKAFLLQKERWASWCTEFSGIIIPVFFPWIGVRHVTVIKFCLADPFCIREMQIHCNCLHFHYRFHPSSFRLSLGEVLLESVPLWRCPLAARTEQIVLGFPTCPLWLFASAKRGRFVLRRALVAHVFPGEGAVVHVCTKVVPHGCWVCCGTGRLRVHGPAVDLWEKEKSLLVVLTYCADYSVELMWWQPCATFFPVHILMLCHTGLALCLDQHSHDEKFT